MLLFNIIVVCEDPRSIPWYKNETFFSFFFYF